MFQECGSLSELNQRRSALVAEISKEPSEIQVAKLQEIHNAYNARRKELLNTPNSYKRLNKIKYSRVTPVMYAGVPCGGYSTEQGTIVMTKKGFFI